MNANQSLNPFYTIGHSKHSLREFIGILQTLGITMVVDVRRFPRSRSNPQFNIKVLPRDLERACIEYRHIAELGGRRAKRTDGTPSSNELWRNESFRNYADYAMTGEFKIGLRELRGLGFSHVSAVMCSEALWWRCHRRIIADYLIAAGLDVLHIFGSGRRDPAHLTPGAQITRQGAIAYPAMMPCEEVKGKET